MLGQRVGSPDDQFGARGLSLSGNNLGEVWFLDVFGRHIELVRFVSQNHWHCPVAHMYRMSTPAQ
jgi:hypothetical protein